MNSAQRDTLRTIFALPVAKNLEFSAIAALLEAVGCVRVEGAGSRLRFVKGNAVLTLHRPHPGKEAKPYQVRDVREFLRQLGLGPDLKESNP